MTMSIEDRVAARKAAEAVVDLAVSEAARLPADARQGYWTILACKTSEKAGLVEPEIEAPRDAPDSRDATSRHAGEDHGDWVSYDGYVVLVTPKGVAIGPDRHTVERWLPRIVVGAIEYDQGGDATEIRRGERIRGIQVAAWFRQRENL